MPKYWAMAGLLMLAATTVVQPVQCVQADRAGNLPSGYVAYTTQTGDSPYQVAERCYGHGYLASKIIKANNLWMLPSDLFVPGKTIVIPPDDSGQPANLTALQSKHY